MKKPPTSLLASAKSVDGHRELAAAVIRQALVDATSPNAPERIRAGARTFLAGSPMLRQWCSVAGLDPRLVGARYMSHESLDLDDFEFETEDDGPAFDPSGGRRSRRAA